MTIKEVVDALDATVVCGKDKLNHKVDKAFSSDLMSDVLTLDAENLLLLTGLANTQTIRTAEMADVECIVFVRNKQVTAEMKQLAEEEGLILVQCKYSLFHTSGRLFTRGLNPVY